MNKSVLGRRIWIKKVFNRIVSLYVFYRKENITERENTKTEYKASSETKQKETTK